MNKKVFPQLGEQYFEQRLENGMMVRVVEKPGFAKKYAFVAVNFGSIDTKFRLNGVDYATPDGVAHYLEHKMFDLPEGNAMELFAQNAGSNNAFTSYAMTAYYVECTEHFEENLSILLRLVTTPYFTEESVEKERGIIAQEIKMYDDSDGNVVQENLFRAMYLHHPARVSVAGTVESIQDITAKTLYDCHRAFYDPSNLILCVVGDVDAAKVIKQAEREEAARQEAARQAEKEKQQPKKQYGFIAVSMGDGLKEFFTELGVDYVIEGGQTMNPSTEDMLNAIEKVHAENIFIFPNNKNVVLAANQAAGLCEDKNIIVLATANAPQGISAMIAFDSTMTLEDNKNNMLEAVSNVKSGQVTYAVRDTSIDGKAIHEGDIMGIGDKGLVSVGNDISDVTFDLIKDAVDEDSELISIYYGADVKKEDAEAFAARVEESFPDCDVQNYYGGQPIYYYIVSVE